MGPGLWIVRREHLNEIARKNKRFPRAKLGTAYRNWPRQYGGATSPAPHCAALAPAHELFHTPPGAPPPIKIAVRVDPAAMPRAAALKTGQHPTLSVQHPDA